RRPTCACRSDGASKENRGCAGNAAQGNRRPQRAGAHALRRLGKEGNRQRFLVSRPSQIIWIASVLGLIGAAILALRFIDYLAPFNLERAPNVFTKYHLQYLAHHPDRCLAALDRNRVDYRRAPALNQESGCGYNDAVY